MIDLERLQSISEISFAWCRKTVDAQALHSEIPGCWLSAYGNTAETLTYQYVLEGFVEFLARRCSRARVSAYALFWADSN
jgi:hypothetical protein